MVTFFISYVHGQVCSGGRTVGLLQPFPFFRRECAQVLLVVVWMVPNRAGRLGSRVDKELMLLLGIVSSDPAFRQIACFILHALPSGGGDIAASWDLQLVPSPLGGRAGGLRLRLFVCRWLIRHVGGGRVGIVAFDI